MNYQSSSFAAERCPNNFVRRTIEQEHYLCRWPDPRSLPFSYCLEVDGRRLARDGQPFGIVVCKKLQHHRQKGLFGYEGLPTGWQVLDVARVWVHPDLQSAQWEGLNRRGERVTHPLNIFTRMVSSVLRRVQKDWLRHHPPVFPEQPYHILLIVSYCERDHYDGTSYRAANFERLGLTHDGTKEIYYRRLKIPRFTWRDVQAQQSFADIYPEPFTFRAASHWPPLFI
jgi:hypothetical protein